MPHDVHEVDRAPFHAKHYPITAADPTLKVVLVGKDRLHIEAGRVASFDQRHGNAITRSLTVGS
jgi:hypothetical protein